MVFTAWLSFVIDVAALVLLQNSRQLVVMCLRVSEAASVSVTVFSVADGILYAADVVHGRILAIDLNSSSLAVIYRARDDLRPYTVAVGQTHVYFSAFNRKFVLFSSLDCIAVFKPTVPRQIPSVSSCFHIYFLVIPGLIIGIRHSIAKLFE